MKLWYVSLKLCLMQGNSIQENVIEAPRAGDALNIAIDMAETTGRYDLIGWHCSGLYEVKKDWDSRAK